MCRVLVAACGIFVAVGRIFSCSMWDPVPWPETEPRPPASGAQSLSLWTTREVPWITSLKTLSPHSHIRGYGFNMWNLGRHNAVQTPLVTCRSLTLLLLTYVIPSLLSPWTHFLFFCGFAWFALLSVHSREWNVLSSQSWGPWFRLRPVLLGLTIRALLRVTPFWACYSPHHLCALAPAPLAPPQAGLAPMGIHEWNPQTRPSQSQVVRRIWRAQLGSLGGCRPPHPPPAREVRRRGQGQESL